jgi:hypothetical protein
MCQIICFSFLHLACDVFDVILQEANYNETTEGDNLPGTPVFEGKYVFLCRTIYFIYINLYSS